ncbi:carboxylesterase family protein [Dyadobacter aurulentus]|uniref:carboxylesterase family protein n=1 Tax=Dyadobacter sp. UC 10 TaxID=2605428 RepID=UPI0011F3677F|nr:prolyl oligopeptidase family serine peptidase [Dyadobacter sp. UC 10]KAA0991992.1 prolyl oligopeptidase family serine peptidase [Dyadobacter sp. UC 10]
MPRQFYYFAIFLFVILILQEILITAMLTAGGRSIYTLDSFVPYFILVSVTQALAVVIQLLYCYGRQYIWPFRAGWLCIISLSVHTAVVYEILINQNLERWYYYSYCAVSAANLLLGLSLVVSKSRAHFWLKWIGITSICVHTAQIALLTWYTVFADFQMKAVLSQAGFVLSWLMVAVTGLWIMHFIGQAKADKSSGSLSRLSMSSFVFILVVLSWFSVSQGTDFYMESSAPLPVRNVSATERTLAERFEPHLFVSRDGEKLPYRLMKPLDYDSTRKYPIVLCLHHGGVHGRDNAAQVQGSYAPVLANYDNRRNHPAFLLVPQCEVGAGWMDPEVDAAVMELMASLEKQYNIDTLRRYVLGESGGGYGSWHFIGNHPGMFAAAIPVCGGGEEELAQNMADVSIWAFHGTNDELVPVSYSRKMVNALRKAGSKPRYTEFPGADHYIGKQVADTPGIWDWLFMQKRKD